jgi:uncharacterized membrane protein YqhA
MKRLLGLKIVLLPMIFSIFLISIIFSIRGLWLCIRVMIGLINGENHFQTLSELNGAEPQALLLLESVDSFLLSFVFFIFSFGLYKIFFLNDMVQINNKLPAWLQINTLFELKSLLWQSILTTIVVIFLNNAVSFLSHNTLSWNILMLPLAVLILSVALYFLKQSEIEKKGEN